MTVTEKINRWPDDLPETSLLVKKLRSSSFPLTDREIAEVLKIVDQTCKYCWDADDDCSCWDCS